MAGFRDLDDRFLPASAEKLDAGKFLGEVRCFAGRVPGTKDFKQAKAPAQEIAKAMLQRPGAGPCKVRGALDLLAELKNTAWTCASINAAVCASNPPKLYVKTAPGDPHPKCETKALPI